MPDVKLYYLLLMVNVGALTAVVVLLLWHYFHNVKADSSAYQRRRHVMIAALAQLSFIWRTTYTLWHWWQDFQWWDYAWYVLTYGLSWWGLIQIYFAVHRREGLRRNA